MSTRPIAPRNAFEGSLGTEKKPWGSVYANKLIVNGKEMTSSRIGTISEENREDILKLLNIDDEISFVLESKLEALKHDIDAKLKASQDNIDIYSLITNGSAAHNSLYRGKDITQYFKSGEMSKAIANGTFKDIFIGDYITVPMTINGENIGDVRWRVGECDYFYEERSSYDYIHHVLMVPDDAIMSDIKMNEEDDTKGGFYSSNMVQKVLPKYLESIKKSFGDKHILKHTEVYTTGMDPNRPSASNVGYEKGASSGLATDYQACINLFNEVMVFGTNIYSSCALDNVSCTKQVALFSLDHTAVLANSRVKYGYCEYWLRSIASSSEYCMVSCNANAEKCLASARNKYTGGVSPYFLLI